MAYSHKSLPNRPWLQAETGVEKARGRRNADLLISHCHGGSKRGTSAPKIPEISQGLITVDRSKIMSTQLLQENLSTADVYIAVLDTGLFISLYFHKDIHTNESLIMWHTVWAIKTSIQFTELQLKNSHSNQNVALLIWNDPQAQHTFPTHEALPCCSTEFLQQTLLLIYFF